eukprot:scaffold43198_cov30-Tisochrysis_lutea.AAC.2
MKTFTRKSVRTAERPQTVAVRAVLETWAEPSGGSMQWRIQRRVETGPTGMGMHSPLDRPLALCQAA